MFVVTTKQKHVDFSISKRMLNLSLLTWFVCYSRGEEESLLGGSCCCQGPLVMWKDWDHKRRHVTLNLLNRREPMIRRRANVRHQVFVFPSWWCAGTHTATHFEPQSKYAPWDNSGETPQIRSLRFHEHTKNITSLWNGFIPAFHYIVAHGFLFPWLVFLLFSLAPFFKTKKEEN